MKRLSFWLFCLAFSPIWAGIVVNMLMLPNVRCSSPNLSLQRTDVDHQGAVAEDRCDQAANAILSGETDWLLFDRNRGKQIRLAAATAAVLPSDFSIPQLTWADFVDWTGDIPSAHSLISQHVRLQI